MDLLKNSRHFEDMQNGRTWVVLLILLALFSSLLPPGMMPGRDRDGLFSVVLCTSDGLKTVFLDAEGVPVDPSDKGQDNGENTGAGPCVFASVHALALSDAGPAVPEFKPVLVARARPSNSSAWVQKHRSPYGARAPPTALQQLIQS
ncbi:DUF2946 family protein [Roseibium sp.]|uniref:DUF2946 family protein n=1 Tax=Roseibium sp. TaxID=1936156 RepID=UPI003A97D59B